MRSISFASLLLLSIAVRASAECGSDVVLSATQSAFEGSARHADAAASLPVTLDAVASVARDVSRWPEWIGVNAKGERVIREMKYDAATGAASVRLGSSPD